MARSWSRESGCQGPGEEDQPREGPPPPKHQPRGSVLPHSAVWGPEGGPGGLDTANGCLYNKGGSILRVHFYFVFI